VTGRHPKPFTRAAVNALADLTVRKRLADLGQDVPMPAEQTPQALGARQKAEIEKWWPIMKAAKDKPSLPT
jgi:hypothetical protein